ncbi:MAG: hypothetical protein RBS07_16965 [Lentimicrobium sp.]|jgi:hypothetical protein|nr:hypothetical protein [Lentimicrobium sp.]
MTQTSNKEMKQFQDLLKSMVPSSEIKTAIISDTSFINKVAELVAAKMISEGMVEDKLLSRKEAMDILSIKSPQTFVKLLDKGITPVRLTGKTGHPRFRMSEINKFKANQ